MVFKPKTLDYNISPYTGLTKESWIEAGEYLLTGIFQHIKRMEDPVVMPRKETKITYPHLQAPENVQEVERKAEIFEGLTRSFFIAAPMIYNIPELELCGYKLREYYKNQILSACVKGNPFYVGNYEEMQGLTGHSDPLQMFSADSRNLCACDRPLDEQGADLGYLYQRRKGSDSCLFNKLCPCKHGSPELETV